MGGSPLKSGSDANIIIKQTEWNGSHYYRIVCRRIKASRLDGATNISNAFLCAGISCVSGPALRPNQEPQTHYCFLIGSKCRELGVHFSKCVIYEDHL